MSWESKVVWSEGMFLNPQHFQQQARYFERMLRHRHEALAIYAWGGQQLELDPSALALGKLVLRRGKGLFPDGTVFDFPEFDNPPPPLEIMEKHRGEVVYLALPLRSASSADVVRQIHMTPARYQATELLVSDDTDPAAEAQSLEIARLCPVLLPESSDRSSYVCIPIARIADVGPESQVEMDHAFFPAMLQIDCCAPLVAFVEELYGLLKHRGDAIISRLADIRGGGTSEIADYLLLQLVNRVEVSIRNLTRRPQVHPLELFEELQKTVGELATYFDPQRRPPVLPPYCHTEPACSFLPVMNLLRQYLSFVYEQNAVTLPLQEKKPGIFVTEIKDRNLLTHAHFVLAVRADIAMEMLQRGFPDQIKIGPVERIRQLVNAALPGIALNPLTTVPREIPFRSGFTYFELDTQGKLWEEMLRSGGFAMHVGGDFPALKMEFWAIKT